MQAAGASEEGSKRRRVFLPKMWLKVAAARGRQVAISREHKEHWRFDARQLKAKASVIRIFGGQKAGRGFVVREIGFWWSRIGSRP